jgi:hypothetical protein
LKGWKWRLRSIELMKNRNGTVCSRELISVCQS